jgi:hypothetical protein
MIERPGHATLDRGMDVSKRDMLSHEMYHAKQGKLTRNAIAKATSVQHDIKRATSDNTLAQNTM